jgi:hypothetical protein
LKGIELRKKNGKNVFFHAQALFVVLLFPMSYQRANWEIWKRKKAMWKIILEILRTVLISAFLLAVAFGSIVLLAWLIKEVLV